MQLANETLVKTTVDELAFFFVEQLGNLLGQHATTFEDVLVDDRVKKGRTIPAAIPRLVEEARSGSILSHKAVMTLADQSIHAGEIQDYFRDLYRQKIKALSKTGPGRDWSRDNCIISAVSWANKRGFKPRRSPDRVRRRKDDGIEPHESESGCSLVSLALKQVQNDLLDVRRLAALKEHHPNLRGWHFSESELECLDLAETAIESIWNKRQPRNGKRRKRAPLLRVVSSN